MISERLESEIIPLESLTWVTVEWRITESKNVELEMFEWVIVAWKIVELETFE